MAPRKTKTVPVRTGSQLLSKNTGIAASLVGVILVMVVSGTFAIATWRGDVVRQGDNISRVEAKIDAVAESVKEYQSGASRIEADMHALRNRLDIIDATGTVASKSYIDRIDSLRQRIDVVEKQQPKQ